MAQVAGSIALRVKGSDPDVESFLAEVSDQYGTLVPTAPTSRRRGVNEIIMNVALGVVGNLTYDALKTALQYLAERNRVVVEIRDSVQEVDETKR